MGVGFLGARGSCQQDMEFEVPEGRALCTLDGLGLLAVLPLLGGDRGCFEIF